MCLAESYQSGTVYQGFLSHKYIDTSLHVPCKHDWASESLGGEVFKKMCIFDLLYKILNVSDFIRADIFFTKIVSAFSEQPLLCLPLASFLFLFGPLSSLLWSILNLLLPIKHFLPCGITLDGPASLPGFLKLTEDSNCFYMTLSPSVFSKVQASTQKVFKNFSEKWINNAPNSSFSFIMHGL